MCVGLRVTLLSKSTVLLRNRDAEEIVDGSFSGEEYLLEFRHLYWSVLGAPPVHSLSYLSKGPCPPPISLSVTPFVCISLLPSPLLSFATSVPRSWSPLSAFPIHFPLSQNPFHLSSFAWHLSLSCPVFFLNYNIGSLTRKGSSGASSCPQAV